MKVHVGSHHVVCITPSCLLLPHWCDIIPLSRSIAGNESAIYKMPLDASSLRVQYEEPQGSRVALACKNLWPHGSNACRHACAVSTLEASANLLRLPAVALFVYPAGLLLDMRVQLLHVDCKCMSMHTRSSAAQAEFSCRSSAVHASPVVSLPGECRCGTI